MKPRHAKHASEKIKPEAGDAQLWRLVRSLQIVAARRCRTEEPLCGRPETERRIAEQYSSDSVHARERSGRITITLIGKRHTYERDRGQNLYTVFPMNRTVRAQQW